LEEIFCCHNIEHIEWRTTRKVLANWYSKLKKNGKIHIRVPNFRYLAKAYLDGQWSLSFNPHAERNAMHAIFGGDREGNCFDYHKVGFDFENLSDLMASIGFRNIVDVSGEGNWELRIEAYK
jgi:predicted SAM-dependent methyltransferase